MTEQDIASRPDSLVAECVLKKHRVGHWLTNPPAPPPGASEEGRRDHRGSSQSKCGGR